jgi:alkyldihydroxyacetonephosphate synthase
MVDLSFMDRVLEVDDVSLVVRAEGGAPGTIVERAANLRGLTLGHDLGSMALSTVGGWVASGAVGLLSDGFGGIEDLLLGLTAVLPGGDVLRLGPSPRSSGEGTLRRAWVGSEGALGIVVEATLSGARLPSAFEWSAFRPNSLQAGLGLLREVHQQGYHPLVARLFDGTEAVVVFGDLGVREGSVLIAGFDPGRPGAGAEQAALRTLAREFGASDVGAPPGERWWERRHEELAVHDGLMGDARRLGDGVVVDVVDVAGLWRTIPRLYDEVRGALLEHGDSVSAHVAHGSRNGATVEFTFLIRDRNDREVERRYHLAWDEAMARCLRANGTLSHRRGVGLLKAPYLTEELGKVGVETLRRVRGAFDPDGVMNPGKGLP